MRKRQPFFPGAGSAGLVVFIIIAVLVGAGGRKLYHWLMALF